MPLLTLAIGHQNKHITVTAETSSMCACVCVCVCVCVCYKTKWLLFHTLLLTLFSATCILLLPKLKPTLSGHLISLTQATDCREGFTIVHRNKTIHSCNAYHKK